MVPRLCVTPFMVFCLFLFHYLETHEDIFVFVIFCVFLHMKVLFFVVFLCFFTFMLWFLCIFVCIHVFLSLPVRSLCVFS